MRKFNIVFKEKQNRSAELKESKVLGDFKNLYNALLEKYGIFDFYSLNEEEQLTFLTELNSYWTEEDGLLDRGKKFMQIRSDVLSESSTVLQKKNFLRGKASVIISEILRQSNLKWKLYDIIDEMYGEVNAKGLADVLTPETIVTILNESLKDSSEVFIEEISKELNESAREIDRIDEKKDPKAEVRNRGDVVFPAESKSVKDDKDHFPINNLAQARNALSRVNQYKTTPSWYEGSLDTLVKKVVSAVKKKYPSIKVSKEAEKPGKK